MLNANRRKADEQREQLLKVNEKVIVHLIDAARFLARQSLAFRGHENEDGKYRLIIPSHFDL